MTLSLQKRPPIPPKSRIPSRTISPSEFTPRFRSTTPIPIPIRLSQTIDQDSLSATTTNSPNFGFGFRLKPSSLPSYLATFSDTCAVYPSKVSSTIAISLNTNRKPTMPPPAMTNNKNKSVIYKKSQDQQQRIQKEKRNNCSNGHQLASFEPPATSTEESLPNPSTFSGHKSLELEPSQSQSLSRARIGSLSVAELATRFLEENVRNCIKPRIFPVCFPFLSFYYLFMQYNFS